MILFSMERRPQFGTRHLSDESDVYQFNAWDNVTWDEEFKQSIFTKIEQNSLSKVAEDKAQDLEDNASTYWDSFYDLHGHGFFKDRHWLFTEFPELMTAPGDATRKNILELGCGVGNTVFPLLASCNESMFVYCCDFSRKAIELVEQHAQYDPQRCKAFQLDITQPWQGVVPFEPASLDMITMLFVLSAIDPDSQAKAIENAVVYLKPGGFILFRDYGFCDLAQARFKNGRCIKDNFYVRGDNTRAYFFKDCEVSKLFSSAGLIQDSLVVDRRLQVNRANKKKMYRIWIQAKFMRPQSID